MKVHTRGCLEVLGHQVTLLPYRQLYLWLLFTYDYYLLTTTLYLRLLSTYGYSPIIAILYLKLLFHILRFLSFIVVHISSIS